MQKTITYFYEFSSIFKDPRIFFYNFRKLFITVFFQVCLWTIKGELVMLFGTIVMTFAPAIQAGLLSSQTEEIKIILHNKMIDERGIFFKILKNKIYKLGDSTFQTFNFCFICHDIQFR